MARHHLRNYFLTAAQVFCRTLLFLIGIVCLPFLLLYILPVIIVFLVIILTVNSLHRACMRRKNRAMDWSALDSHLSAGTGTVIVGAGWRRIWWTGEVISKSAPIPMRPLEISSIALWLNPRLIIETRYKRQELKPFANWLHHRYLNGRSGIAQLVIPESNRPLTAADIRSLYPKSHVIDLLNLTNQPNPKRVGASLVQFHLSTAIAMMVVAGCAAGLSFVPGAFGRWNIMSNFDRPISADALQNGYGFPCLAIVTNPKYVQKLSIARLTGTITIQNSSVFCIGIVIDVLFICVVVAFVAALSEALIRCRTRLKEDAIRSALPNT